MPDDGSVAFVTDSMRNKISVLGLTEKVTNRLMVAVDEIYSNVVRYGGATRADISVSDGKDGVMLVFEDDGKPYNPTTAREPDVTLSADEREIGGLGIFMVKKMATEMKYEYSDGKNRLTVVFG